MRRADLERLSTEELIARFVAIGLAQDQAELYDDIPEFNRLYDQKRAVVEELQRRPGDQRLALLALYNHDNLQVRLNAVKSSLALAPEEGRRVLRAIADSMRQPYAGEAGMTIRALDKGIFKPT